jgi:predicted HTH transcriptional regulator
MADQPEVPVDDKLIDQLLEIQESPTFETKRVGDNRRKLETVVSFANSEGGFLVLGIEDPQKASGRSRVFANRIEIENPGLLPGGVTVNKAGAVGSRPRNRALVDHLREFPSPPNLDAREGVRMMKQTMSHASLYPPIFLSVPKTAKKPRDFGVGIGIGIENVDPKRPIPIPIPTPTPISSRNQNYIFIRHRVRPGA